MGSKKRIRQQNPEPFLRNEEDDAVSRSSRRSKGPKNHQKQDKLISSNMSSKILKEALKQQQEIHDEEAVEKNPSFANLDETKLHEEEEDIDDFSGFDETKSQFGGYDVEIDEDDEKLLDFFLSKDVGPHSTLADIIARKIKETEEVDSSDTRPLPKLDRSLIDLYKGVGQHLRTYTSGKMPKAFKHIPAMQQWEDILYLTEPENWSPNAMYQATRIFASNLGVKKAERFYRLVLLPRVREDIRKNKRLHFALYQSLKKSLYKPAAFNKGILFPLCESRTCTLREAVIIGSIIEKVSIPHLHSSVAILKLEEMEYCGTTSYFIKLLFEKKYALPYRVLDATVLHFMKFLDDEREMPVIWHQSLLAFMQRYKNELTKEDKKNLRVLVQNQKHRLVTPEILRELNNSISRGEKELDPMLTASPVTVIRKPIEEDRFDIPPVEMEED